MATKAHCRSLLFREPKFQYVSVIRPVRQWSFVSFGVFWCVLKKSLVLGCFSICIGLLVRPCSLFLVRFGMFWWVSVNTSAIAVVTSHSEMVGALYPRSNVVAGTGSLLYTFCTSKNCRCIVYHAKCDIRAKISSSIFSLLN
jgi:uncharacterized membrane protein YphA (DoxX/SURF4 family)